MNNPFLEFSKFLSSEQLEMCEMAYDMIRSTYSTSRLKTALSGRDKEILFRNNSAAEQEAIIDYILDSAENMLPDEAIVIAHLMFGIFMMEQAGKPNKPATDGQQIMRDCIAIILRKYNTGE